VGAARRGDFCSRASSNGLQLDYRFSALRSQSELERKIECWAMPGDQDVSVPATVANMARSQTDIAAAAPARTPQSDAVRRAAGEV